MIQQGQVFELKRRGRDGEPRWAYRYRAGGRGSRRIQRGGFANEQDAIDALEREFDRLRASSGYHAASRWQNSSMSIWPSTTCSR
jgi:hypothetical protein